MATSTLNYYFEYENGVGFKLSKKYDAGDWETIIDMDENAHIAQLTTYIQGLCEKSFELDVTNIMNAMKA